MKTWIALSIFALVMVSGCHEETASVTPPSTNTQRPLTNPPENPGAGNLVGTVVGTIYHAPLAGITVTGGSRTTITDSAGQFWLNDVGSSTFTLSLSGAFIYPRSMAIDPQQGRVVTVDAIETDSAFHLEFYRELVRGHHPEEGQMLPLQRWTQPTPPTFYIDVDPALEIPQATIETTRRVIREMLPLLSGNLYQDAHIEERHFDRDDFAVIPANAIVISFKMSLPNGALGVTFTQPDLDTPSGAALTKAWIFMLLYDNIYDGLGISRDAVTAHELGHGFGFHHTAALPSLMAKRALEGWTFSQHDRLHIAVAYRRPVGNLDIDIDPSSSAMRRMNVRGGKAFVDRHQSLPSSQSEDTGKFFPAMHPEYVFE